MLSEDYWSDPDILAQALRWGEETEAAEESLREFMRQAWPVIEGPAAEFVDGWHIGAICEHLEAVYMGQIENLLINVPPRSCKSNIVSVALCPWIWTREPDYRFLYAAYASDIAIDSSLGARKLIQSDWYQARWGHKFNLLRDQNNKKKFVNNHSGHRTCMGVGGPITGRGGSVNILDDPNNTHEGEVVREGINKWFGGTWGSRQNNLKTGRLVLVQQRYNDDDLSGHIMKNHDHGNWVKLILPMEYETNRRCKTIILPSSKGKIWEDPRKKEKDLLWPNHIGPKELTKLKSFLGGEYVIAGQLQQRPAPEEGGLIKRAWFPIWEKSTPPKTTQIIQSWDTALKANEINCYSACTTYGLFKGKDGHNSLILLSMWRGRVEYPDLRKIAQKLYEDYRWNEEREGNGDHKSDGLHIPDLVLIEDKMSGSTLLQDFRRAGINAAAFDPNKYGDKMQRVHLATPLLEAGRLWLPARAPDYKELRSWAKEFVDECAVFPNASSRDIVDTLTQVILRLKESGLVLNPNDKEVPQVYKGKSKRRYY